MKAKKPTVEQLQQFKRECEQIELITGKKWQWVLGNYSLPELIRLQGAMLALDFF